MATYIDNGEGPAVRNRRRHGDLAPTPNGGYVYVGPSSLEPVEGGSVFGPSVVVQPAPAGWQIFRHDRPDERMAASNLREAEDACREIAGAPPRDL
jgi:hypothetical protein